jgi:hypothetical protein
MHADRTNRFALIIFGLLVLLAGAAAMASSLGWFGRSFAHQALFANRVGTYFGQHGSWLWPAIAGGCLIIALAALRWILVLLFSTDRAGDITVPGNEDHGTTILRQAALTGALTREIETYHGVDKAKARIIGDPSDPRLVLTVTAAPTADLASLHRRIEQQALHHARQALGDARLPIQLDLDVSRRSAQQPARPALQPAAKR